MLFIYCHFLQNNTFLILPIRENKINKKYLSRLFFYISEVLLCKFTLDLFLIVKGKDVTLSILIQKKENSSIVQASEWIYYSRLKRLGRLAFGLEILTNLYAGLTMHN